MDNLMITKGAKVERLALDDAELREINRYTTREFTADEVFTFKVALCDDKVDREHERFTGEALEALAKLYVGKPVIADHDRKAGSQCARIYSAAVEAAGAAKRLVAKCYMVRSERAKDLITEIEGGIKKEVSVGCRVEKVCCSICGADNRKVLCEHVPGREYGGRFCHFRLEEPTDAYEVSFVAVPAQPAAGVVKQYGGVKPLEPDTEKALLAQRLRAAEGFLYINKQEE